MSDQKIINKIIELVDNKQYEELDDLLYNTIGAEYYFGAQFYMIYKNVLHTLDGYRFNYQNTIFLTYMLENKQLLKSLNLSHLTEEQIEDYILNYIGTLPDNAYLLVNTYKTIPSLSSKKKILNFVKSLYTNETNSSYKQDLITNLLHSILYIEYTGDKTIYQRLVDFVFEIAERIDKQTYIEYVIKIFYKMLENGLVVRPEYFDLLNRVAYDYDKKDIIRILEVSTYTKEVDTFRNTLELYEEMATEEIYKELYEYILTYKYNTKFKKLRDVLLDFYRFETPEQHIDTLLEILSRYNAYNTLYQLKLLGYKITEDIKRKYYTTSLFVYTIDELEESDMPEYDRFDTYGYYEEDTEYTYQELMNIYMMNRSRYEDNIEAFYRDIKKYQGKDYRKYKIEDNVLLNLLSDDLTKLVIGYM